MAAIKPTCILLLLGVWAVVLLGICYADSDEDYADYKEQKPDGSPTYLKMAHFAVSTQTKGKKVYDTVVKLTNVSTQVLVELLRLLCGLRLVSKSSQPRCRGLATGCFGLHIIQPPGITAAANLRQSNARPKGQGRIPSRSDNCQRTKQPTLLRSALRPITAMVYSTIRTPRSNFSAN
ncbi:hypothetical protein HPB52_002760 [Rhipicephalus sanguineus]|uniref:Cystatin domain-containing protein n=1 Tax=Rhipicephalus sanguineus TaxID=34632 RepID=A0A9D4T3N2_RHISA|nr:hypothetical protein HPB52_002760 [Rhipicephalus sanguineus]